MDFERQKPVSDAYRENFERVWGKSAREYVTPTQIGNGKYRYDHEIIIPTGDNGRADYKNGCPILPENGAR